jgi:hypothetical protein
MRGDGLRLAGVALADHDDRAVGVRIGIGGGSGGRRGIGRHSGQAQAGIRAAQVASRKADRRMGSSSELRCAGSGGLMFQSLGCMASVL